MRPDSRGATLRRRNATLLLVGLASAAHGCSKPTSSSESHDAGTAQAAIAACSFAGRYAVTYTLQEGTCDEVQPQVLTVTGAGANPKMTVEGGQLEGGAVFDAAACNVEFSVTVQNPAACGAGQRTLRVQLVFGKAGVEGKASTSGTCKGADCTGRYAVAGAR